MTKITHPEMRALVSGLMAEMGLSDSRATVDEICQITYAVLAKLQTRKAEPPIRKMLVPDDPDAKSGKQAVLAATGRGAARSACLQSHRPVTR